MTAGVSAYALWGVFPLIFHQLRGVNPVEVISHRIIWSAVVVSLVLVVRRDRGAIDLVRTDRAKVFRLAGAGAFLAVNWGVYVWAVQHDRVLEGALGYYINPLITVALGVGLLGEHLRRAQVLALALGAVAVVVLGVAYGRPPWIALILAATFAVYAFSKRTIPVGAATSLAVETLSLTPFAIGYLIITEVQGTAAFGHSSLGRNVLLISLGAITAVPLLLFGAAATRIPLSMIGLLQYLTPTLQLLCGVVLLGEGLPPARLAGFVIVWIALAILAADALRNARSTNISVDEGAHGPDPVVAAG